MSHSRPTMLSSTVSSTVTQPGSRRLRRAPTSSHCSRSFCTLQRAA